MLKRFKPHVMGATSHSEIRLRQTFVPTYFEQNRLNQAYIPLWWAPLNQYIILSVLFVVFVIGIIETARNSAKLK